MYSNICLIGLPYSGKSFIGKQLAQIKKIGFIETDIMISNVYKSELHKIIKNKGKNEFIKIENNIIESLHCENCIISTGGSVVYNKNSLYHLKNNLNSYIIHLELSMPEFMNRIDNIEKRGIINPHNLNIKELYNERIYLCNKYADLTINSDIL